FPKRACDNAPILQRGRSCLPDLNDGPMPSQGKGSGSIRLRPANDEVVLAAHQDADHSVSALETRVGHGAPYCEVIDDLAWKFARIPARQRIVLFLLELFRAGKMLLAGFGNHGSNLVQILTPSGGAGSW